MRRRTGDRQGGVAGSPLGVRQVSSRSVQATWQPGPLRCEVEAGGFTIPVDEPEAAGGTGLAPQPTDLFLASVASCFTLALVHSARGRGLELTSVRVHVVGDYAGPRFEAVRLVIDVPGPSIEELAGLVEAAERVCYVSNTLRLPVRLTVDTRPTA
jgi:organic hydroperoxide reductase OsmC/OhrA